MERDGGREGKGRGTGVREEEGGEGEAKGKKIKVDRGGGAPRRRLDRETERAVGRKG